MNLKELRGKKIGILGLGINHQELVKYLLKNDLDITVRDRNESVKDSFLEKNSGLSQISNIKWQIQKDVLKNLDEFDVVFRTPIISYIAPELQRARRKGLNITSQTRLFFDLCPAKIIGISGTKGKGTTSTMLYELLKAGWEGSAKASGGKVYLAGNIGTDPFVYLDQLRKEDIIILELSSFQLEDLDKSPNIAILLNVTPDHLDRHHSFGEYQAAKLHLLAHQKRNDIAIVYGSNNELRRMAGYSNGKKYLYTVSEPTRESVWVSEVSGKEILYVQLANKLDSVDITKRKLLGKHHLENIVPAVLAASLLGVNIKHIETVLNAFSGLPHRFSLVGEYEGVGYYDDSIATTPEAAIAALGIFKDKRIHWIAGGKDKGVDYRELAELAVKKCDTISLLPGSTEKSLLPALKSAAKAGGSDVKILATVDWDKEKAGNGDVKIAQVRLMEQVVSGIILNLKKGDVVILSPACASDYPYANYKERGDALVAAVKARFKV